MIILGNSVLSWFFSVRVVKNERGRPLCWFSETLLMDADLAFCCGKQARNFSTTKFHVSWVDAHNSESRLHLRFDFCAQTALLCFRTNARTRTRKKKANEEDALADASTRYNVHTHTQIHDTRASTHTHTHAHTLSQTCFLYQLVVKKNLDAHSQNFLRHKFPESSVRARWSNEPPPQIKKNENDFASGNPRMRGIDVRMRLT